MRGRIAHPERAFAQQLTVAGRRIVPPFRSEQERARRNDGARPAGGVGGGGGVESSTYVNPVEPSKGPRSPAVYDAKAATASIVRSISSSPWAVERNIASFWLGAT